MKTKTMLISGCVLLGGLVLGSCGSSSVEGSASSVSSFDSSKKVTLYSRESGSGTRECFFEGIGYSAVKKNDSWNTGVSVNSEASNAAMMEAIGNDEYGIGYCSLDSLSSLSTIKGLTYEGVEASQANVLSGDYKLKRNFNYVTKNYSADSAEKQAVEGFIAFLTTTNEGYNVIKSNGGIISRSSSLVSWESIKGNYAVYSGTASVTINFCGSTSVEKIIQAAKEKIESTETKVTYVLNQSGSGDAVKGVLGTLDTKDYGIGFLSREISADEQASLTDGNKKGSFAIDAVVPIVNAKNTFYTSTTAAELTSIYKGEKTTWSSLK